jgi:small-conductance mechanosensitive channel
MLRNKPDWWDSDEANLKNKVNQKQEQRDKAYEEHSGVKLKKKKVKLVKSDNIVIKELSDLLLQKDSVIDSLEVAISKIENKKQSLEVKERTLRKEYNKLYAENLVLKDIINNLDVSKLEQKQDIQSNDLFLTKDAPQDVVDLVWKTLSKTCHPDCGGSEEKMKLVNLARDTFYKDNGWK